jgi:hypothetical protein
VPLMIPLPMVVLDVHLDDHHGLLARNLFLMNTKRMYTGRLLLVVGASLWMVSAVTGCSRGAQQPSPGAEASASARPESSARQQGIAPGVSAEPMVFGGKPTGYSRLPSGLIVKTGSLRCPSVGAVNCPSNGGNPTDGSCRKDTDCVAGLNGYCGRVGLAVSCSCHYGCFEDPECAQGEACVCNGVRGQCVPAPCRAGGCKEGTCSTYFDGDKYHPFACRTETGPMGPVQ